MPMGKAIPICQYVYERLDKLKNRKDHQTFDSAIRGIDFG